MVSLNTHMTTKDKAVGEGGRTGRCPRLLSNYGLKSRRVINSLKTRPATMANKGERGETEEIGRGRSEHGDTPLNNDTRRRTWNSGGRPTSKGLARLELTPTQTSELMAYTKVSEYTEIFWRRSQYGFILCPCIAILHLIFGPANAIEYPHKNNVIHGHIK
ncbi:hypothetical protein AX14_010228, partial [Amanita brunnescens Koide BX004]